MGAAATTAKVVEAAAAAAAATLPLSVEDAPSSLTGDWRSEQASEVEPAASTCDVFFGFSTSAAGELRVSEVDAGKESVMASVASHLDFFDGVALATSVGTSSVARVAVVSVTSASVVVGALRFLFERGVLEGGKTGASAPAAFPSVSKRDLVLIVVKAYKAVRAGRRVWGYVAAL